MVLLLQNICKFMKVIAILIKSSSSLPINSNGQQVVDSYNERITYDTKSHDAKRCRNRAIGISIIIYVFQYFAAHRENCAKNIG